VPGCRPELGDGLRTRDSICESGRFGIPLLQPSEMLFELSIRTSVGGPIDTEKLPQAKLRREGTRPSAAEPHDRPPTARSRPMRRSLRGSEAYNRAAPRSFAQFRARKSVAGNPQTISPTRLRCGKPPWAHSPLGTCQSVHRREPNATPPPPPIEKEGSNEILNGHKTAITMESIEPGRQNAVSFKILQHRRVDRDADRPTIEVCWRLTTPTKCSRQCFPN